MSDSSSTPISRDEIEAKYNTTATPSGDYRNPYLNALGYVAVVVLAIGVLVTLVTAGAYGGPMQGLGIIAFGLSIGLFWLVAGAVVHAVRSTIASK